MSDLEKKSKTKVELLQTAFNQEQLSAYDFSQIAVVGRSNVGKSSLINALAGRKKLAKISSTPGKTRSINFYKVNAEHVQEFLLVDLPGYGHASRSKSERQAWGKLIDTYLKDNPKLCALLLLLDARLSPQKNDLEMLNYARSLALTVVPVLTKSDKCTQRELAKIQNEWSLFLDGQKAEASSAKTARGVENLWSLIFNLVSIEE